MASSNSSQMCTKRSLLSIARIIRFLTTSHSSTMIWPHLSTCLTDQGRGLSKILWILLKLRVSAVKRFSLKRSTYTFTIKDCVCSSSSTTTEWLMDTSMPIACVFRTTTRSLWVTFPSQLSCLATLGWQQSNRLILRWRSEVSTKGLSVITLSQSLTIWLEVKERKRRSKLMWLENINSKSLI